MTEAAPPELAEAIARFDRGDFAGARAEARRRVADPSVTPAVAEAARALLARLAPDPWALPIGILVLAVLALVTGVYVGR